MEGRTHFTVAPILNCECSFCRMARIVNRLEEIWIKQRELDATFTELQTKLRTLLEEKE